MNDLITSIKLFFYERASNPLVTSFVISWCIWNYKFFVIFFSAESIHSKIFEFEELYKSSTIFFSYTIDEVPSAYSTGLLYPFITALVYIVTTPFLFKPIIQFHYGKAAQILNAKNSAEGKRLLTEEESRKLIYSSILKEEEIDKIKEESRLKIKAFESQIEDSNKSYESQIETLLKEVVKLKEKIETIQKERDEIELHIKNFDNEINTPSNEWKPSNPLEDDPELLKLFQRILVDIGTHTNLSRKAVIEKLGNKPKAKILVERAIDLLLETSYVSKYHGAGGEIYELQPSGREYIIKHKLMNE